MEAKSLIVPAEMSQDAEAFVRLAKEAAGSQGLEDNIHLLRPKSKGFGPAELTEVVLRFGEVTAMWLTTKWIDTYLWPLVKSRLDAPSKNFIDWIKVRLSNDRDHSQVGP